jgi:hypothetical protein
MVRILDPNRTAAFALAAAVTRHLPPPLAAIEAKRRTRTSSQSFPSSSCSRRTPTLSHCRHPSPKEPPRAATAVGRDVCCPRWAPLWSPLHFVVFPITFGAPECPGCRAPVSRPLGYGAAEFPLSCRRRRRPELLWAIHALIDGRD